MNRWLCIIVLLPLSPLFAKDKKLEGYVLDPAAFRRIRTYCIDTHNLPPREVWLINQFVSRASRPKGLFARLPWHRLATCQGGGADAVLRMEFPRSHLRGYFMERIINGALLIFQAGSPGPIYETREVTVVGQTNRNSDEFDRQILEYSAIDSVIRVLIHDRNKFSETIHTATTGAHAEGLPTPASRYQVIPPVLRNQTIHADSGLQ